MRRRVPPGDGSQLTTTADNFSPQHVNNRHVYFLTVPRAHSRIHRIANPDFLFSLLRRASSVVS